jgi:hypothetical protein
MAYSSSKRKLILDRVESLLGDVTLANGFPIEIKTISREELDFEKFHSEDSPVVMLSIGSAGANSFITTGSNIDSIINIIIRAYIYTQPEEIAVNELDKLLWSIQHMLMNGTVSSPWNDKYKTASLNELSFVYYSSFDDMFNTDEGLQSLEGKAWAVWPLTVKYLASTINP